MDGKPRLALEVLHLSPFSKGIEAFEKASPPFLRQGVEEETTPS